MIPSKPENIASCSTSDISAYVDGELSADESERLETHFSVCIPCRTELNRQKNFLNFLDASLESESNELPPDFTKKIVTKAESGVRGLRDGREWTNAAAICIVMLIAAAGVFFSTGSFDPYTRVVSVFDRVLAVSTAAVHFVYSVALSIAIVVKTLTHNVSSRPMLWLAAAICIGAMFFIARRLVRDRGPRGI